MTDLIRTLFQAHIFHLVSPSPSPIFSWFTFFLVYTIILYALFICLFFYIVYLVYKEKSSEFIGWALSFNKKYIYYTIICILIGLVLRKTPLTLLKFYRDGLDLYVYIHLIILIVAISHVIISHYKRKRSVGDKCYTWQLSDFIFDLFIGIFFGIFVAISTLTCSLWAVLIFPSLVEYAPKMLLDLLHKFSILSFDDERPSKRVKVGEVTEPVFEETADESEWETEEEAEGEDEESEKEEEAEAEEEEAEAEDSDSGFSQFNEYIKYAQEGKLEDWRIKELRTSATKLKERLETIAEEDPELVQSIREKISELETVVEVAENNKK